MNMEMFNTDFILNFIGTTSFITVLCLWIALIFKIDQIKKLKFTLDKLKRSFDELDEQAKLIVKTDLELNKTQEELDKKVADLYTLQRLSRAISTTLDEEQIFARIEEPLIREFGFEKALAFTFKKVKDGSWELNLRIQAGYSEEEAEKIKHNLEKESILSIIIKNNAPFSSLNAASGKLKQATESIKNLCLLSSFAGSIISTKDGPYGLIIMGNESSLSVLIEGDEEIVGILANQLGQAIENAKLFEETFRSHQELERRVTERTKELTDALSEIKQISKRKSEFVSAVSHELRTPLTSIKGYASILTAGTLGELPAPVKERIERIHRHSNELTDLINNLLDISRIESGKVEMKLEAQNLSLIIEKVADLLMPQIKEKQLQFSLKIPAGLGLALADAHQIERVFINLISNAIKYTPNQGKIGISAVKIPDNYLRIDVSDSGYGIPLEDLNKIFNEFYRVDSMITRGIKGTGLGLSLVKYIIEAHKGKIWATSKLNEGSIFSFTLPVAK